jgi:hypothetical protein
MFKRNEANWDRAGRVVLGLALLALGLFVVDGTLGVVLAVVAFVPLLTGALGSCPLYSVFGVSTCPIDSGKASA